MNTELCYLSAIEALELFQSRQLSPAELMSALIEQAESVESEINAFSHTFFEEAMDQTKASELRYLKGEPIGSLDGIAVAIKDEVSVEGQKNTEGSLIYEHKVETEDAILVARLRREGAIFHARTTCPEFSSLFNTQSRLFGVTRNPWNLEITPGGSSGGAGASLAAATTTLASGSDIGGSIRFPASQCGLIGYKPPFGRVPETLEPYNLESYCANGPMARTVSDAALMQNVISGAHPTDSGSALPKITLPLEYEFSLAGQRIAWNMTPGTQEPEADVMRNTHDSLQRLKALGAEVVEVTLEWPEDIERAYYGHMDPLFFSQMAYSLENHRDLMCDYNIHMVEQALERLKDTAAFYKATCIESEMYRVFGSLMENYDVFVCPTVLSNQLRADFNPAKDDYIVNGVVSEYDLCISNCHLFNMMGRCPAISVPSGIGDNGVPTGLHIASKANDDIAVFRVAAALESSWDQPFRPGMR